MLETAEVLVMPRPRRRFMSARSRDGNGAGRPEMPSRDEVRRLLTLLSRRTDAERDYPLFLFALETGMRPVP